MGFFMNREHVKRWYRIVAIVLIGFFVAVAGIVYSVQPILAALVCPRCFGFEQLSGRVLVDSAVPESLRVQLASALREGEMKVVSFYGELKATRVVLACATDMCWRRLGGGAAKANSYASFGVRLSPRGIDPVIVAHERSHIELHARLGLAKTVMDAIPACFDEGLAVLVSDDPRYLLPNTESDRCRVKADGKLPIDSSEWRHTAGTDQNLYARAACRVLRWMNANGGKSAVLALVEKVTDGEAFSDLYRDPAREKT
jgi:hypothetical protein